MEPLNLPNDASRMTGRILSAPRAGTAPAFSLVELLVVVGIIALLAAIVLPAVGSLGGAYSLTRQGQLVHDQIVLARQMATSRNRNIEVLLTETNSHWSVQLWQIDTDGGPPTAIGKRMPFAENVMMDTSRSPLLTNELRFHPNGRLAGQIDNSNNFLTLQLRQGSSSNFFTLQINPVTGRVATFRP
jgi:prepilin-type N-terminal cleavage/methylation domain-containing protein